MIDPFQFQKQMFPEFEKNLNQFLIEMMKKPEFMELIGKNLGSNLDLIKNTREHWEPVFKTLGFPTEKSLEPLYKTVHNLETRLLNIEEKLEKILQNSEGGAPSGFRDRPPRDRGFGGPPRDRGFGGPPRDRGFGGPPRDRGFGGRDGAPGGGRGGPGGDRPRQGGGRPYSGDRNSGPSRPPRGPRGDS